MATTKESKPFQRDEIEMQNVIDETNPFYFFYKDGKTPYSKTKRDIVAVKKIKEKVRKEEKTIRDNTVSVLAYWVPSLYTTRISIPQINGLGNADTLDYIQKNYRIVVPDYEKLKDYKPILDYGKIIELVKDTNDYVTLFKRSYNQLLSDEKDQLEIYRKIENGTEKNKMLMSKKLRSMKKIFDDVEKDIERNSSIFNYYKSDNMAYKMVKFLGGMLIQNTAKQMIVQYSMDNIGNMLGTILGPFATAPVYIIINIATTFLSISTDKRESFREKLIYSLTKGTCTGIIDVVKTTVFPMMALSGISLIVGNIVVDGIMVIFDPKLNKKRSDDLAKTYGDLALDPNFIKNSLNPPKLVNTVKILAIVLCTLKVPLEWVAELPEAVLTYVSEILTAPITIPMKALNDFGLHLIGKIYGEERVKSIRNAEESASGWIGWLLNSTLITMNFLYKLAVKTCGAVAVFLMCKYAISNYTPFPQIYANLVEQASEYGIWDTSLMQTIRNVMSSGIIGAAVSISSWLNYALSFISYSVGIVVTFADSMGLQESIISAGKNMFLYLCENHKSAVVFMTRTATSFITPSISTFLKANTQHYMFAIAPALYAAYMKDPSTSHIELINSSISYAKIAVIASVCVNIVSTFVAKIWGEKSTVDGFRKIDEKYKLKSGFSIARFVEKVKFTLGNSLIITGLDQLSTSIRNNFFGSWIEYVEVNFGRRDFFNTLNFSGLTNRILIDGYFEQALTKSVVDIVSNVNILQKIEDVNAEVENNFTIDREAIRRAIDINKSKDAEKEKTLLAEIRDLKTLPASEDITMKILEKEQRVEALKGMQKYYDYNEQFLQVPEREITKMERGEIIKSIIFNQFNPFVEQVDPSLLGYLQNDQKVQVTRLINDINKDYARKIQTLQLKKEMFENDIKSGKIKGAHIAKHALGLNREYSELQSKFKTDENIGSTSEYIRMLNDIIITQYSYTNVKSATDISTYYKRSKFLSGLSEKISIATKDIEPFKEQYLINPEIINESLENLRIQESHTVSEFQKQIEEYEKYKKDKPKTSKRESKQHSEEDGYFTNMKKKFTNMVAGPIVELLYSNLEKVMRFSSYKKQTALKNLAELKELEQSIRKDTTLTIDQKSDMLVQIEMASQVQIQNMNTINNFVIDTINNTADEIQPVDQRSSQFAKAVQKIKETQKTTGLSTMTDIETSTDYQFQYETAFGASPESGVGIETPYTGENVEEVSKLTNAVPFLSGSKINIASSGGLKKMMCGTDTCTAFNEFIDKVPDSVAKEFEDVQLEIRSIIQKIQSELPAEMMNKYSDNNLLFAYMNPITNSRLSSLPPMSKETKEAFRKIFDNSSPHESRMRYFKDNFEDDIKWNNPHLLFFLSTKTYRSSAVSSILARSNINELNEITKQLQENINEERDKEIEMIEKIKKYEILPEEEKEKEPEPEKLVEEPSTWSSMFLSGMKFVASSGVNLLASASVTVVSIVSNTVGFFGNDAVQNTLAAFKLKIDGYSTERNAEEINKTIEEQIKDMQDKDTASIVDNLRISWFDQAKKVDELVYQEEIQKIKKANQWTSETLSYNVFQFTGNSDFSGIISPTTSDILHTFFADDEFGVKQKFVKIKENMVPENIKEIAESIAALTPSA